MFYFSPLFDLPICSALLVVVLVGCSQFLFLLTLIGKEMAGDENRLLHGDLGDQVSCRTKSYREITLHNNLNLLNVLTKAHTFMLTIKSLKSVYT